MTRKLNALKAQLPDRERRLLSSMMAAVAGVFTAIPEVPATATVEAARRASPGNGTVSVQDQFAAAFAPGTRAAPSVNSIKLPPSEP